jgi:flagellar basal-body rod protein FlgC
MDIFAALKISSSALTAQRSRIDVVSSNLANLETTRTPEGGPYRKRDVVFRAVPQGGDFDRVLGNTLQTVEVAEIRTNPAPPRMVFDPAHADANPQGFVAMPNMNLMEEMADLMTATRSYEANVTAIQSAKRMALKALEIGR